VGGDVGVSLLVPLVLGDVVEVVPADDDGPLHLADGHDLPAKDASSDGDVASEWALVINEGPLNGGLGSLEAQTHVLHVAEVSLL